MVSPTFKPSATSKYSSPAIPTFTLWKFATPPFTTNTPSVSFLGPRVVAVSAALGPVPLAPPPGGGGVLPPGHRAPGIGHRPLARAGHVGRGGGRQRPAE